MYQYLEATPILIPFIIGLYKYQHIKKWNWLFFFVCYGAGNELLSILLIESGVKNTMYLSHLYTIMSFVLLNLFYRSVLHNYIKRKWFLYVIVSFLVFYSINFIFNQGFYDYPSLPFSVTALVIILYSLFYFYKTMIDSKIIYLSKEPLIWINIGILIWFSGNLFFNILFNVMLDFSRDFLKIAATSTRLLSAILYVLIAIGFWKTGRNIEC